MSTTGVSFKVEAQTPAADTLEGLARAAEHARLAEAQLGAQMKAVNVATVGHASAVQAAAKGMDAAGYAAGNLRFQMIDVGKGPAVCWAPPAWCRRSRQPGQGRGRPLCEPELATGAFMAWHIVAVRD